MLLQPLGKDRVLFVREVLLEVLRQNDQHAVAVEEVSGPVKRFLLLLLRGLQGHRSGLGLTTHSHANMVVIDHFSNVLHVTGEVDNVIQLPLCLRSTLHHPNELRNAAVVALQQHLLVSVLGRVLPHHSLGFLNPCHERVPLSALEGERHGADDHARRRASSSNLTVEHEIVLVVGKRDTDQVVDRRSERSLLIRDWNAEERDLHIRVLLVESAVHLLQLDITLTALAYGHHTVVSYGKKMHHALILLILVIHHNHRLVRRGLMQDVLFELALNLQHTLSTMKLPLQPNESIPVKIRLLIMSDMLRRE